MKRNWHMGGGPLSLLIFFGLEKNIPAYFGKRNFK